MNVQSPEPAGDCIETVDYTHEEERFNPQPPGERRRERVVRGPKHEVRKLFVQLIFSSVPLTIIGFFTYIIVLALKGIALASSDLREMFMGLIFFISLLLLASTVAITFYFRDKD